MNEGITVDTIKNMSYTDFISLIRETNRCPGGKDTIRKILLNSFVSSSSKVLEIGSNTGFTSLEVARTIGARVEGIDISESCVAEARRSLTEDLKEVQEKVRFQVASAYDIPFGDSSFDLVITGGATSFMEKKQDAVKEYIRVTKPWGFISVTQLFYAQKPPKEVVERVSAALGVTIEPMEESQWLEVFNDHDAGLELYYYEKNELTDRPEQVIDEYINYILSKDHLVDLPADVLEEIRKKWKFYLEIFNLNHKYLGYFIALFRKRNIPEEPELFIRK